MLVGLIFINKWLQIVFDLAHDHSDKKAIFSVLSNDIRRRIFLILSEHPCTYTWLLEELEIESGHLAYHLRNMGGLIEKDSLGVYRLSSLGLQAYKMLNEDDEKRKREPMFPFTKIVVIVLIAIFALSVFSILREKTLGFGEDEYLQESVELINHTLFIVYEIFNEQSVDRNTLTELVVGLVELEDRIMKLSFVGTDDYVEYVEIIKEFREEFVEILKNSDEKFLVMTLEKRQRIRDLHSFLLEFEAVLKKD